MHIGFIGAGKVGTAFGIYLSKKCFKVTGYYSKTFESAIKASKLTKSTPYKKLSNLCCNCDIIFITTNDDEIEKVCERLVQENILTKGQIIIHMSGASSSKTLNKAKTKGCFIYSLHPLQSFADIDKAVTDLENTFFTVEGDKERIDVIENILKKLGNEYFVLSSEQKSIYHATACVVSNYLVTLIDYGLTLFDTIGMEKDKGFRALYPLIEGTIKNIYNLGPEKALTGPIARGDVDTIKKHIESLSLYAPDKVDFYKILGKKTLELAEKNKLKDKNKIKELKEIF
ncbi:Rossmann-like and DUF2520 domain-containing protein [Thermohalobacter berrensis]|uniref:Rossmann-like and DUF2520 domain-containing protein n=1 Tax=Thermohalobacter berrensis TaxID=99594 RepID=UPI0015FFD334|nr:Rossmann-like and DUF2520 domain-containing protein [Thermohalobacter berrensis]